MTFAAHRARKRFGQHWLMDGAVLDRIVAAAELEAGEVVLEIGPGRGALSERLLASPAARVAAIELDRNEIGEQLRSNADRVIDLGDPVIESRDAELIGLYEEPSTTYQQVSLGLADATTAAECLVKKPPLPVSRAMAGSTSVRSNSTARARACRQ